MMTDGEILEENRETLEYLEENREAFNQLKRIMDSLHSPADLLVLTPDEYFFLHLSLWFVISGSGIDDLASTVEQTGDAGLTRMLWLCRLPEMQARPDTSDGYLERQVS